jgi:hypothetical protein
LTIGFGGVYHNQAGAVFDARGDGSIQNNWGGSAQFINDGTFRKTAGTGAGGSGIHIPLENSGIVEAQVGMLLINGTLANYNAATMALTGGVYRVHSTLKIAGADIRTNAATIELLDQDASIVNSSNHDALANLGLIAPAGVLRLRDGFEMFLPGELVNQGELDLGAISAIGVQAEFRQQAAGRLIVELPTAPSAPIFSFSADSVYLDGSLHITMQDGFVPTVDDEFLVVHTEPGARFGEFSSITTQGVPDELVLEPRYLHDRVTLVAVELGANGVWDGGGGADTSWHNPLNWSNDVLPGADDDVLIPVEFVGETVFFTTGATSVSSLTSHANIMIVSGTLSLASESTMHAALTLQGGVLSGAGTLTVLGQLNWTGGTMSGSGKTAIAATAQLNINGSGSKTLSRTLNNAGTAIWADSGVFGFGAGTVGKFNNLAGATFDVRNDLTFGNAAALSQGRFDNAGLFVKSAGTGTTVFPSHGPIALDNTGIVEIQTGSIQLATGESGGEFRLAAGTFMSMQRDYTLAAGATVTGNGQLRIGAATTTIAGNVAIPHLVVAGSAVLGGSGALTVTDTLDWTGGTMSGSGTTAIPATAQLNISGSGSKTLSRTLNNSGTAIWTDSGVFGFGGGTTGTFNNLAGATFDVRNDLTFGNAAALSTGRFDNAGLIVKSAGTGTTVFPSHGPIALDNTGIVEIQSGSIQLATGESSGEFRLSPETSLNMHSNYTLVDGATITGSGEFRINAATTTINGDVEIPHLVLASANTVLTGSGLVTVNSAFDWTGGRMEGSGKTAISAAAQLDISGSGFKRLSRTLDNAGTAIWADDGVFSFGGGTVGKFNNLAGATFDVRNDLTIENSAGFSTGRFDNAGLFVKSAGTGTTSLSTIALENTGTVEVRTGTLAFAAAFTQTAGATLLSGGNLSSTQTVAIQGGTVAGNGTITGDVNNSGGVVAPGTPAGELTIIGNYTQGTDATLLIEIGGLNAGSQFDQLVVGGTAALAGTLAVELIGGFVPAVGNTFSIIDGTTTGDFATLDLPALPVGRDWEVQSSSVTLAVVGEIAGVFWDGGGDGTSWHDPLNWSNDVLPGPDDDVVIDVPGSPAIIHSQGDTVIRSLTSSETLVLEGGSLALSSDSTIAAPFTLTDDGLLTGGGRLTLEELFVWSGGTMAGSGVTVSTERLRIEGAEPKFLLDTRTLNNAGDMLWTGGEVFRGLDHPTFNNFAGATFFIQTDDDFLSGPTASVQINNLGRIVKSSGVGTTSLKSPVTSTGTVEVQSGVLRIIGGYTQGEDGQLLLAGGNVESNVGFNLQGGELRGYGRIVGHVQSSAAIDIGGQFGDIGTLEIVGNFEQTPAGSLHLDLDAPSAGVGYDRLVVGGTATLNGTLAVSPQDGFSPSAGFAFDVLDSGARSGVFQQITGTQLSGGKFLTPDYQTTGLSLVVFAPPDSSAAGVSQFLIDGLQFLGATIADWVALC